MNILEEAGKIIYGDREQTYGSPAVNLNRIAAQWSLYLFQKFDVPVELTAEDVCWMMVDLKKCRQINADKRDNLVDAAGYLALIERAADVEDPAQKAGPPRFETAPTGHEEGFLERAIRLRIGGTAGSNQGGTAKFRQPACFRSTQACNEFSAGEGFAATQCRHCGWEYAHHNPKPTVEEAFYNKAPAFPEPLNGANK